MANHIRRKRLAKGWSQEELSDKMREIDPTLGKHGKQVVNKLEKGRIQLTEKYLNLLAEALDCHPGALFDGGGRQPIYIKGHIKMGEPREKLFWPEEKWDNELVPKSKRFEKAHRFIIEDRNNDALLECVDDDEYVNTLIVGKRYIAAVKNDHDVTEYVVVKIEEAPNGELILRPDYLNGKIPRSMSLSDDRVKIVARIIRSFQNE